MARLFSLLIVAALIVGQAYSASAALCVHGSAAAHQRALSNGDGAAAAVAEKEDSAAAMMAKKAAASGGIALNTVAHLDPPSRIVPPDAVADRTMVPLADAPPLNGISTAPLLRPPHAIG